MKKSARIYLSVITIIIVLISILAACKSGNDYVQSGSPDESEGNTIVGNVNRKIYYTVDMELISEDTLKTCETVEAGTVDMGGYVEYSTKSMSGGYPYFRYTVRIPTDNLEKFLSKVEGAGNVSRKQVSTTDITKQYTNAESRVKALENEKEVLEGFMRHDDITVSDVLSISERISKINTELDALNSELNNYDSLIDFSTVTISIEEPEKTSVAAIVVPIVVVVLIGGAIAAVVIYRKKKAQKDNSLSAGQGEN